MNRKLINGLLLLTVATGGVGTFTSCKDGEQDFQNQVLVGQKDLEGQIAALRNLTDAEFKENLDNEIQRLIDAGKFASAEDLTKLKARVLACEEAIEGLNGSVEGLNGRVEALETVVGEWAQALEQLGVRVDGIETTANDALTLAQLNAAYVNTLKNILGENGENFTALKETVDTFLADNAEFMADFYNWSNNVNYRLDDIEAFNEAVESAFNYITDRLNKLVTGIIIQQTHNPIFGTINLPIGLQTTVLGNYYAMSDHAVTFPDFESNGYEYSENPALSKPGLHAALQALTVKNSFTMAANTKEFEDVDNNLGNLYLTVNPNNVNFNNLKVTLVDSQDKQVLNELKLQKDTETVLTHGYTRSNEDNGFYRVDVKGTAADIDDIHINIESGFKSAVKDVIKQHKLSDFAELGKLIYDQLNGMLPAYGVKVGWTVEDVNGQAENYSVISDYDLAVATWRPFSFRSGADFGIDRNVFPVWDNVSEAIDRLFDEFTGDIKFNLHFDEINGLDDVSIDLSNAKFTFDPEECKITIDLSGIEAEDEANGIKTTIAEGTEIVLTYNPNLNEVENPERGEGALNDFIDELTNSINEWVNGNGDDSLKTQINKQINDQLMSQVDGLIDDINEQLNGINAQIDQNVKDILADIKNKLNGKLGRFDSLMSKYSKLAKRLNKMLKNPNHYLQVMAAYQTPDGNFGRLSNAKNAPTRFSGNGAFTVYATTYNAELVVPVYKKFVAITRGWDANGNEVSVSGVNTNDLSSVVSGRQERVVIDTNKLKSGCTYEVFYTALDFRGFTSSQVYYIHKN